MIQKEQIIFGISGLSHDGDKGAGNRCKEEAEYGSVMAPMVGATFRQFVNKADKTQKNQNKARILLLGLEVVKV